MLERDSDRGAVNDIRLHVGVEARAGDSTRDLGCLFDEFDDRLTLACLNIESLFGDRDGDFVGDLRLLDRRCGSDGCHQYWDVIWSVSRWSDSSRCLRVRPAASANAADPGASETGG